MKKLPVIFIILICIIINKAGAQYVNYKDGKPLTSIDYTSVDGSPYLTENWVAGTVKLANGTTYTDVMLKYNLKDDELYFKNKDGETLAFAQPVQEFTLKYTDNDELVKRYLRKGYKGIENATPNSYFEVLSDGTVQLLKKVSKVIIESQAFNSATKTRSFQENVSYYLVRADKAVRVKNDKKSILANIPDKQQQLQDYLKANKVNFRSDTDLAKFITYYNSL
jgi:hypothetical protein